MSAAVRVAAALALAALLAAASASVAHAHGTTVTLGHGRLSPERVTIPVGGTVHFYNEVEMPGGHTVVADDGSFESPPLGRGGAWHRLFTRAGEYPYHIGEHPEARGVISVVEEAPPAP